jgi:hypothetical protein
MAENRARPFGRRGQTLVRRQMPSTERTVSDPVFGAFTETQRLFVAPCVVRERTLRLTCCSRA